MTKIYVAKRVIDYVGLLARGIPESTLAIDETMAPVLALMQGMGSDGAKLLSVDANGNLAVTLAGQAGIGDVNVSRWSSATLSAAFTWSDNNVGQVGPATNSLSLVYDGAFHQRQRTPVVFKSVALTAAGSTAIWTPAAGKRFRLMRYIIQVPGDATLAAAAEEVIQLLDVGASIGLVHRFYLNNAAVLNNWTTGWIDLGNGYLSTAINQALNGNLGTVLATGNIVVTVAGTEE